MCVLYQYRKTFPLSSTLLARSFSERKVEWMNKMAKEKSLLGRGESETFELKLSWHHDPLWDFIRFQLERFQLFVMSLWKIDIPFAVLAI